MDTQRIAIKELSDRLVEAQRPIRLLSAVNWDDGIRDRFFAEGCTEQPAVDASYYASKAMTLDPVATRAELLEIEAAIAARLGPLSPAASLMRFMCEQFRLTVDLIEARGTPSFSTISGLLYGSTSDVFHVGGPTVSDLAMTLQDTLDANAVAMSGMRDDRTIPGDEAARRLQAQLDASVGPGVVDVREDDGIASDAAAGSDYIKIRSDRRFSQRDIDLLEAHEGWVHVATTLNGLNQPYCTFLGKAAPRTTVTQEGLAVLTEMLNNRSHPRRLAKLMRRIEAIRMAEEGATFVEVFRELTTDGMTDDDAWVITSRVFRGSTPTDGPFTKDLGYGKGLILTLMYVRMAIRFGRTDRIPMLFCGKVDLLDLPALHHLEDEGIVSPPTFVPPPFDDLPALATSLSLGRFTSQLDVERMSADYQSVF